MKLKKDVYPNLSHPGVGLVLISEWVVKEDTKQVVDSAIDQLENAPWPDGMISYSCFLELGGHRVIHYVQWKDSQAHQSYVANQLPERQEELKKLKIDHETVFGRFNVKHSQEYYKTENTSSIALVHQKFRSLSHVDEWIENKVNYLKSKPQQTKLITAEHFHIHENGLNVVDIMELNTEEGSFIERAFKVVTGLPAFLKKGEINPEPEEADIRVYTLYQNLVLDEDAP